MAAVLTVFYVILLISFIGLYEGISKQAADEAETRTGTESSVDAIAARTTRLIADTSGR